ncbi:MAG: type II secretion system protein GspJ [Deltaproteobacteria bacterium]|nr:type II secretion system protein GspJ [Deltaproteobacteria bacterium]
MSAPRSKRLRARVGMTLLEVIVATGVFAMMGLMLLTGFTQTGRLRDRLNARMDRDHQARIALQKITQDLRGAFVSAHVNGQTPAANVVLTGFVGREGMRGDTLEMTTFTHRRLRRGSHEGDAAEIGYRVVDHRGSNTYDLLRRETSRIDNDPVRGGTLDALVLDVTRFDLKFYDETTNQWTESWNTMSATGQPGRLPQRVRIGLTLRDEGGRERAYDTECPVMIQSMLRFGLGLDWR